MSIHKGQNLSDGTIVKHDKDANSAITELLDSSDVVLDFTNSEVIRTDEAIGLAVGVMSKDKAPHALVFSFAIETGDEDGVVTGERRRTTVVIPIAHAFRFGTMTNQALSNVHDFLYGTSIDSLVDELKKQFGI